MVLSKFPIVDYQVVLLPRQMDDKRCACYALVSCVGVVFALTTCHLINTLLLSDDHQRVILNVKVAVPETHLRTQSGACSSKAGVEPVTLDIMTSHFRLAQSPLCNESASLILENLT